MGEITVAELLRHFEEKMHQIEYHRYEGTQHKEPKYPMVLLFFGEEAIKGFRNVISRLHTIWPSYANDILSIGVRRQNNEAEYLHLSFYDNDEVIKPITKFEAGQKVSALFGERSPFVDKSSLLDFSIVNTTDFKSADEFSDFMEFVNNARTGVIDKSVTSSDLLFVLLNENIGENRVIAKGIKNRMIQVAAPYTSTLLFSNHRDDETMMENWYSCNRMIAATVALVNNADTQVMSALFNRRIYSAAYACEEKPIEQIGLTVIKELIERLSREKFGLDENLLKDRTTFEKLGISREGTFVLLDDYAQEELYGMLPDSEKLALFPRNVREDKVAIDDMTENQFNTLTMNCWQSLLNGLLKKAREKVERESAERFKKRYSDSLFGKFSISELIWLKEHVEDVRESLTETKVPLSDVPVLSAAKGKLRYVLAETKLPEAFLDAIRERGEDADEFLHEWNNFIKESVSIRSVKDENIESFYDRKVRDFFDRNEVKIMDEFRHIQNMGELKNVLFGIVDRIIESDQVFSVSFEDEMETRLQEEALPSNAKQYIRQKLTGENLPLYFSKLFDCGRPVACGILVKTDTQLYANLREHIIDSVCYYDTGSSESAEAINYYLIEGQLEN